MKLRIKMTVTREVESTVTDFETAKRDWLEEVQENPVDFLEANDANLTVEVTRG